MERFACPTPDRQGRYRCIDDHVLCDGFIDCPDGEDEERQACMFYKTVSDCLYVSSIHIDMDFDSNLNIIIIITTIIIIHKW